MKTFFLLALFILTLVNVSFTTNVVHGSSEDIISNLYLAGGAAELSDEQIETDARDVAVGIINAALTLFGIVFLGLLIYGGWLWMTATGNKDQVDKAKQVIQWAAIGMAIVIASFSISTFVADNLIKATGNASGLEI